MSNEIKIDHVGTINIGIRSKACDAATSRELLERTSDLLDTALFKCKSACDGKNQ